MCPHVVAECVKTMHGHDHNVSAVVFSGEETVISCSRDHSIKLWNVTTGYCTKTLSGHTEWVRTLAVAGDLLLSGGHDKSIRVWNISKGTTQQELFGHEHVVECVAFAPPASNPWIEDLEVGVASLTRFIRSRVCVCACMCVSVCACVLC